MKEEIVMEGPIAYMAQSNSAVYFSKTTVNPVVFGTDLRGTAAPIRKLMNLLDVALWGEDNRFPQNIEQLMSFCGIGKTALDRKARQLWGNGIIAGKITNYDDDGNELFTPMQPNENKDLFAMMNSPQYFRFWLEYLQDWAWFGNCFPEMVFSKDGSKITNFVHQESCDCRYKQMNDQGVSDTIFLTKMWGASGDQFAKFDPKKVMRGLIQNPVNLENTLPVDGNFIKQLDCADMYNPVASLKTIADKQVQGRKSNDLKSAILPCNYPSPNKTYYQVPSWDGARLGGWIEIAIKIPLMVRTLYAKAFNIKYHIQIPEKYFEKKYGIEQWEGLGEKGQQHMKKKLLEEMNKFLAGDENAYKTFISFFDIDPQTNKEYGLIKIDLIQDNSTLDKELMTTSAANVEILMAMGVHPSEMSAGSPSDTHQSGGGSGSDIREAGLMNGSLLGLERQVLMAPLYVARDFNGWDPDIVFRMRDVVLTTLDTGGGTAKKVS